jgi:hypothetical protein|tara:strand:+ start:1147 stop:1416 length:270 start_codon:yes stop_codon:yes gene_type:complete
MKLKDLLEQETTADKDMKAAKKLLPRLTRAGQEVAERFKWIEKEMSSFNAPGLRSAFAYALKSAIGTTGKQGFDMRKFEKVLSDYYKGR